MESKRAKRAKEKPDTSSRSSKDIDPKKIEVSFLAMKKMLKLSSEETASEPLFTNEGATVYLHITLKQIRKKGLPNKILLQHPLSFNRPVCFIANHMDKPAQSGKVTQILQKVGVTGKIKTIPISLVKEAVKDKNVEALEELAMLYETHIVEEDLNMAEVALALNRHNKRVVRVDLQPGPGLWEKGFLAALSTTLVSTSTTNERQSLYLRVAHVGMSPVQVVDNVHTTMSRLISKCFLDGYKSFSSILLKSGDRNADVFELYRDGDTDMETPEEQEQLEESEQQEQQKQLKLNKEAEHLEAGILKEVEEQKARAAFEASLPKIPLDTLQLSMGLSNLKLLLDWTGAGKTAAPRFTDQTASLYLCLKPWTFTGVGSWRTDTGYNVTLPHALSMKRRVCVVVPWAPPKFGALDAPDDDAVKEDVRDAGVQGFVRIVHRKKLSTALAEGDDFAASCDTFIGDPTLRKAVPRLVAALRGRGKEPALADLGAVGGRRGRIAAALATASVAALRRRYTVAVGHTGMTQAQVTENILSVLAQLPTLPGMPATLDMYRQIQITNGANKGTPIFITTPNSKDKLAEAQRPGGQHGEPFQTNSGRDGSSEHANSQIRGGKSRGGTSQNGHPQGAFAGRGRGSPARAVGGAKSHDDNFRVGKSHDGKSRGVKRSAGFFLGGSKKVHKQARLGS